MEQKTRLQVLNAARRISDTRGQTARHPDTDLNDYINEAYRAYRSLITSLGFRFYLTSTAAAPLAGTEVADETYHEVDFPADAAMIRGIDIQYSFSPLRWVPLKPITQVQRRDYQVLPPLVANGNYKIWYLPNPPTFTGDTDIIVTPPEGLAWIEAYVGAQLCIEDDDPENTLAGLQAKMQEIQARTLIALPKTVSAGSYAPRRRGSIIEWWDDPGYFAVRTVPEGSGATVTDGRIQLFLNRGV